MAQANPDTFSMWREELPRLVRDLQRRWSLSIGPVWNEGGGGNAWVAPAVRSDGTPAVLKIGMPHMEGLHEIPGLRFWNGDPTVRLLDADEERNALLLERCEPGTALDGRPEPEQDVVVAGLLRRLWRTPPRPHPFRPLADMASQWAEETIAAAPRWIDPALVHDGLDAFRELSRPSAEDVLLATDLHAGNVLRAQREPWLAIDPKPFVGDRAYDATQHLLNCRSRMLAAPHETIRRFAGLLEVDGERVQRWMFARLATEPPEFRGDEWLAVARALT